MAFQFINTTAEKREPDEKTRKKIRSQVMKDYRRRKEEEDVEAHIKSETGLRPGSPAHRSSSRSSSKRALRRSDSFEPTTPPPGALGERSTKRGRPNKIEQERAASLFLQTAHGLFSNFTVNIKSNDLVEEGNIAGDNAEVARMISICDKFAEWLVPESTRIAGIVETRQAYNTTSGMLQLYALSLMAIGHLAAIGVYEGDEERSYYKARLLELANKSLQDPTRACEDSTLTALACLASYEVSFGSHEALTHLSGISRIIEWRGGMDDIRTTSGLAELLQVLDLLHAVSFHVEPVYVSTQDADDSSSSSSSNDSSMDESIEAAHEWQDLLRGASSFLHDNDNLQGSRACFLAWRVALFQPKDNDAWSSESIEEMRELYRLMVSMTPGAWHAYPALQARVLLTALATDTDKAHRSWYYSQLSSLMFHTEEQYWNDLKSLVSTFIDSQAHHRRPRVQTVRAMVSGVEIVIERSLAAQFGLQTVQSC